MKKFIGILIVIILAGVLAKVALTDNTERLEPNSNVKNFAYEALSDEQKDIYEQVLCALTNERPEFNIEGSYSDDFSNIYSAVLHDNPEIFWVNSSYSYTEFKQFGGSSFKIEPDFTVDMEKLDAYKQTFDKKLKEITAKAGQKKSDYDKVLFVFDYIVENTEYDQALSEEIENSNASLFESFNGTPAAYNCLVEGKAVCSGYTEAFQTLLHRLGISCGKTTGKSLVARDNISISDSYHVWNYVELDGECYYVDVTWGDPISNDSAVKSPNYDYFCINSAQLNYTHEAIDKYNTYIPECTATKYDYFLMNNMFLEDYSFADYSLQAQNQASSGIVSVKFASAQVANAALNDLIENKRIFDIPAISNNTDSIKYSQSISGNIITIYL